MAEGLDWAAVLERLERFDHRPHHLGPVKHAVLAHERLAGVDVRVHRDGGDPHLTGGADHAARDLASVGDEELAQGHHIRNTPHSSEPFTSSP